MRERPAVPALVTLIACVPGLKTFCQTITRCVGVDAKVSTAFAVPPSTLMWATPRLVFFAIATATFAPGLVVLTVYVNDAPGALEKSVRPLFQKVHCEVDHVPVLVTGRAASFSTVVPVSCHTLTR